VDQVSALRVREDYDDDDYLNYDDDHYVDDYVQNDYLIHEEDNYQDILDVYDYVPNSNLHNEDHGNIDNIYHIVLLDYVGDDYYGSYYKISDSFHYIYPFYI
jgi:hypothetical protein